MVCIEFLLLTSPNDMNEEVSAQLCICKMDMYRQPKYDICTTDLIHR